MFTLCLILLNASINLWIGWSMRAWALPHVLLKHSSTSHSTTYPLLHSQTSYIFAVLISFYVRKVYDNTHSNFMVRYWKKILALVLFQALLLAIPFAMSFFASNEYSVPYSFGPNGFYMPDGQYYLFYCGPVSLDTPNGIIEYLFNIPFFSIVLLVVHCRLLCLNHQSKKRYSNLS